ncbi:MAG: hypothetical protein ACQERO_10215 [Bacteroidota bacterium]
MSKKVYSEEEVVRLIRRAVELESERTKSGRSGSDKGLTIHDLEKIAADSGIDPELMHKAAEELDNPPGTSDFEETTKVNKSEILAEHWIKADVNSRILDDLIIELNHRFGTSQDDINWWDQLWNDYSGKAKVNKTATSADWRYTDEMAIYTTRVLIQQRSDKLRIRVSKRMAWNLSWNSEGLNVLFAVISAMIITTLGAVLGFSLFNSPSIGILGGLALSALIVPLYFKFTRRWLNKHKQEVTEIAENLVIQAKKFSNERINRENESSGDKNQSNIHKIEIETMPHQSEESEASGRLRNHLKE